MYDVLLLVSTRVWRDPHRWKLHYIERWQETKDAAYTSCINFIFLAFVVCLALVEAELSLGWRNIGIELRTMTTVMGVIVITCAVLYNVWVRVIVVA